MCTKNSGFGIPVEVGSLIFGIIFSLLSGVLFILVAAAGFVGNIFVAAVEDHAGMMALPPDVAADRSHALQAVREMYVAIYVFVELLLLLGFIFSVLLANGASNRKPGQVKAYLVYGSVVAALTYLVAFIALFVADDKTAPSVAILVCTVYCLVLHVVRLTYVKFTAGVVHQFAHKPLHATA